MWLKVFRESSTRHEGKAVATQSKNSKNCGLVVKASEVRKRTTQSTRHAMYVERNIVTRSLNHCRSGKGKKD
jgi:hypothetical protein